MLFFLALIPIALILVLMIGFRWGAARAGGAGYLSALTIAITVFGAGPELLAIAHVKALLLTVDVLLIIWAAFLLYRVADEAGAIRTIGTALPHLTADQGMQALIIGWVFAAFLQGVGGFGVPVAVIAPILIGLGFTPLAAVVIPSIGHGWAVTFGSLGSSFNALLATTGQPEELIAPPAAIFLGVACLASGLMVSHAVGGFTALRRLAIPVLATGAGMAVVQYLVAVGGAWNIAAFIASLAGMLIIFPMAFRNRKSENSSKGKMDMRALLIALSGYGLLILVTLVVQLVAPVKSFLGQVAITTQFPEISTALGYTTPAEAGRTIKVFGHTGTLLFYASVLAFLVYSRAGLYQLGAVKRIVTGMIKRVMSSSVSIASMVAMVVVMGHAGMTDALATGLAQGTGALFPLVSPWIGALGAFMTGSNTNSNVVFGELQLRTAEILGYSAAIILGAQTAGAAVASILAPTKIVVGASTAGMDGKEGDVMRKLLVYAGILVALVSLLALAGVLLS